MNARHTLILVALLALAASCRTAPQEADLSDSSVGPLSGTIAIDGSNTLLPVSQAIVDDFTRQNPQVHVSLAGAGTVAGFKRFCAGETDISDASRPMDQSEIEACGAKGVQFIELPIGFDALTVVVNGRNAFVDCLTLAELKELWQPEADGKVTSWNQVRSSFPARHVALFGSGTDSGTYDYFTLAVVGTAGKSRTDYTHSSDYEVVASGVAADTNALGYVGFAYYAAHREAVKAVAINGGKGCVAPSADAVHDNSYQPLSRPLFIYVKKQSVSRPEVRALVRTYLDPATTEVVKRIGYVPLPLATTLRVGQRFEDGTVGSVFGGRGAVLGITAATFHDEDKIKSALVR